MEVSRRMDETRALDEAPPHFSDLRRARGISLEAISERTKISVPVLEALEAERFERFPRGIFARSYVRSYAIEAGLDPDTVLARVIRKLPGDEPIGWLDMGPDRDSDARRDADNGTWAGSAVESAKTDARPALVTMVSRIPWRTAAALVIPIVVLLISAVVATVTIRELVWPSPPAAQASVALAHGRDATPSPTTATEPRCTAAGSAGGPGELTRVSSRPSAGPNVRYRTRATPRIDRGGASAGAAPRRTRDGTPEKQIAHRQGVLEDRTGLQEALHRRYDARTPCAAWACGCTVAQRRLTNANVRRRPWKCQSAGCSRQRCFSCSSFRFCSSRSGEEKRRAIRGSHEESRVGTVTSARMPADRGRPARDPSTVRKTRDTELPRAARGGRPPNPLDLARSGAGARGAQAP